MTKQQIVKEIHRDARKNFERRKYSMRGINDTLQADLIEMQQFSRKNLGYRYILIVIDVFLWLLKIKQQKVRAMQWKRF